MRLYCKKKIALCLLILMVGDLVGCSLEKNESDTESHNVTTQYFDSDNDFVKFDVLDKFTDYDDGGETEDTDSHKINMELIKQHPELPTGCESVALTMVLRYYGFDISKTEIAKNYLIYSQNGNYVLGFVGNPFYASGSGCYAPGMTDTANAFLRAQGSKLSAENVTGASLDELYKFVKKDIPVLIWVTSDYGTIYSDTKKLGNEKEYNGVLYDWTYEEHCVVLAGYNKEAQSVLLYDPIKGIVSIDAELLDRIYKYMYSMAVVIK